MRFERNGPNHIQNPSYPRQSWDWAEVGTLNKRSEELENAFLKLHNISIIRKHVYKINTAIKFVPNKP